MNLLVNVQNAEQKNLTEMTTREITCQIIISMKDLQKDLVPRIKRQKQHLDF